MSEIGKKTFFIGDIHGCHQEFLELLDKINYSPDRHRVIVLGDVIYKGPSSLEALKWIKENKAEVILGNHEMTFLKELKSGKLRHSFLQLKNEMGSDVSIWSKWIQSWPLYIEEDSFIAVHAGLVPDEHPSQSEPHYLVNIRLWDSENSVPVRRSKDYRERQKQYEKFSPWYDFYRGDKLVIHGHWADKGLNIRDKTIGLDSGCVYGGHLSGFFLEDKKLVQVKAKRVYCAKQVE